MNKTKKTIAKTLLLVILSLAMFLNPIFIEPVFAGDALLSPSSGTFTGNFSVTLVSTGTNAGGVDVDITYTGPITFTSGTEGAAADCFFFSAEENTDNVVSVTCMATELTGTVNVATLNFTITGTGATTFTLEDMGDNLDSVTGATYVIGSLSDGDDDPILPQAGIGQVSMKFIAFIVLFVPIIIGMIFIKKSRSITEKEASE